MAMKVEQFYRHFRHSVRVHLSFIRNYFVLRRLKHHLKQQYPVRRFIAIMLLENMGDIVACEPVVRYINAKQPDSYIVWGVKKAYRELIDSNPNIDYALILHCLSERMLLIQSGVFDEVVDLHFSGRYCSLCRTPLGPSQGSARINLNNYFDHGGLLASMSLNAELPALDQTPNLLIPQNIVERINELGLPEKFIAINCASNAGEKNWLPEKWDDLINCLFGNYGIQVVEIGLMPIAKRKASVLDLCGKLSILESAEVLRRAAIFIGIDSGPAHLANAVGSYGVILIGNYLGFERYNPFSGGYKDGANATIIYSQGLVSAIQVEQVVQVVMASPGFGGLTSKDAIFDCNTRA